LNSYIGKPFEEVEIFGHPRNYNIYKSHPKMIWFFTRVIAELD